MAERRLLILGGTAEARTLAEMAARRPGLAVTVSLAGRTRDPAPQAGTVHVGGFGGADGLAQFLGDAKIDLVVDATHPFAARISRHAADACARLGTPLLMLARPAWSAEPGDRWIEVADVPAAATALATLAAEGRARRAFLTVGRQELGAFAGLDGIELFVRLVERPETPPPLRSVRILTGRGPFGLDAERALLAGYGIDVVVSKNSGGEATYAKIVAARELGLPVIMVRRPVLPEVERAADVESALAWIAARAG
ncbi:MAG TPA: cobalt-precorrin-6A reductase [Alphaproteobacteria bacterium]|nr:cobalt-precorrin-6A reductase [Alphaproteobacteria bacterium]